MATLSENKISVIKQVDSELPNFLDFEKLRKEGIDHIAKLSGKIWTDHNVHDPGITMLELLVYALMDLGYKTNLPFKDLIAPKEPLTKDDNFLRPLEILTVNPVTITDYRKLLLELKDVRNVWLEPAEQEVPLSINSKTNILNCSSTRGEYNNININGLYKIYIEKEPRIHNDELLKEEVRVLFSNYRNLCEDLATIEILTPIDFGVCVEVELEEGQEVRKIYVEIIHKIKNFIQPDIKYYTLDELLNKGKTITEIFAGRPYRKESVGFVDTEELEKLERREAFHLSDLYNVILSIPGVRKIKNLHIKGGTEINVPSEDWIEGNKIGLGEVPVFSLEKTCVDLYSAEGFLSLDKIKIHRTFSFKNKFQLPLGSLNTEIPYGNYPTDLNDFLSIQHDLPVVYGIGDDGLPDNASLLRKTQALQLKGYLLFYDQLLANYTAQLTQLRSLFSLKPENERTALEKQTYFSQVPDTVPGLEELLKFYDKNEENALSSQVALPVKNNVSLKSVLDKLYISPVRKLVIGNECNDLSGDVEQYIFTSNNLRNIFIEQLTDSFFNENYGVEIYQDLAGYFFVLCPEQSEAIVLVGLHRFEKISQASNEAKKVAFLASIKENYGLSTDKSEDLTSDAHTFGLNFNPISYVSLIRDLIENKDTYRQRRQTFLDHLLARFGEKFTDYTVLHYQQKIDQKQLDQDTITDQSTYLNQFAEISRNRGKGYNYMKPSWNTPNVSGFEKRISLLAGLPDYNRRNLCNYEVFECRKLSLKDHQGNILFRSNTHFESRNDLVNAAGNFLMQLKEAKYYPHLEKNLNSFDTKKIERLFSHDATSENIQEAKFNFKQVLYNNKRDVVASSEHEKIGTKAMAEKKREAFVNDIKKHRLLTTATKNCYVDANVLETEIETLRSWKWQANKPKSSVKIESPIVFDDANKAWSDLVKKGPIKPYISWHKTGYTWSFTLKADIILKGSAFYPDTNKTLAAWRRTKTLGVEHKNYEVEKLNDCYRIHLKNSKGLIIASTIDFELKKYASTLIQDFIELFKNRGTKPEYIEEKEKFGFKIPGTTHAPRLISYCLYDDEKASMKALERVYDLGANRKNYLLSGDEANPAYNFMLRNEEGQFLAQAPEAFEIGSNRNKELTKVLNFIKGKESPILVKEQAKRFVWELKEDSKTLMRSSKEYASENNARKNCDRQISEVASKGTLKTLNESLYDFEIVPEAIAYNYVYGDTDTSGDLNPVFKSAKTFSTKEEASRAYGSFVKKLPELQLKRNRMKGKKFEFSLSKNKGKEPVAIQYSDKQHKASIENATAITAYMSSVYRRDLEADRNYIAREMTENKEDSFAWNLLKKNAPIAITNYIKSNDWAEILKPKICSMTPPVNLHNCPPKKTVVCPKKNPKKFHYQVCFQDHLNNAFVLNSYVGYTSAKEATDALKKEWIDLIQLARDPLEYDQGRISTKEVYKDPESDACGESSFIAVIPEENSRSIGGGVSKIIKHYTELADIFPIYKELGQDDEVCYRYKMVMRTNRAVLSQEESDILSDPQDPHLGDLIWKSVTKYKSLEAAIEAYHYFYSLAGLSNNCRIYCDKGKMYIGLVEVLAESFCEFESVEEAWDDAFPENKDTCYNCTPGGIRAFIYATEDCKNFIPVCRQNYWTFKVVDPTYFVANHACYYDSEVRRDREKGEWLGRLEKLNWSNYITKKSLKSKNLQSTMRYLSDATETKTEFDTFSKFCNLILTVRKCLKVCPPKKEEDSEEENLTWIERFKNAFDQCLIDSLKGKISIVDLLKNAKLSLADLLHMSYYFPVYKTDSGYCYRLYWTENDEPVSEALQPCGCEEETEKETETCSEAYPFISSQCYDCCEEALKAFIAFCELITNKIYEVENVSKTEVGPYSFQIIDKRKELAYHPQHYKSLQEVENAITITKDCVSDVGMHLLEHVLLRPTSEEECVYRIFTEDDVEQHFKSCLLPICPDYDCTIDWQPDLEKDDPCAEANSPLIHYVPGSDPYSFWATLALPAWAKRFRTKEARVAFEKLLYKEVPALVGLHILWLSPRDMCKFEENYRKWLVWMQDHSSDAVLCDTNGIPPNCLIIDCIKTLETEEACLTKPGAKGECNCNDENSDEILECCLPKPPEGSIFWSPCLPSINEESHTTHLAIANIVSTDPVEKKKTRKKGIKKASKKEILAKVRQRKPQYLVNIKALENEAILKTKSFERSAHFLKNIPTVGGYIKLVNFFKQYSLQKDNHREDFLVLLKNATWYLLDQLVLNNAVIKEEELEGLQASLTIIKEKGQSLKEIATEWHIDEVKPLVNTALANKFKRMLK